MTLYWLAEVRSFARGGWDPSASKVAKMHPGTIALTRTIQQLTVVLSIRQKTAEACVP